MTQAIVRCRKNIRLSIVGRSNAAKSLAATHIDPSIHYPIKKDQTLEAQKIYDNYVIGTTKLGVKNFKYMNIEKDEVSCINIIEYSKAARVKFLHEAITTENQLASTFFESALKPIEIDKKSIPKMAPWEISALSKLVGNFGLKFWEKHLQNLMKSGLQNTNTHQKI